MKEFVCYIIIAGLFFIMREGYLHFNQKGKEKQRKSIRAFVPGMIMGGCTCLIFLLVRFLNPEFNIILDTGLLIFSILTMYISINQKDNMEIIDKLYEDDEADKGEAEFEKTRCRIASDIALFLANLFVWMI